MTSLCLSITLGLALAATPDEPRLMPIPEPQNIPGLPRAPLAPNVMEIGIAPCQHCGVSTCRHKVCRIVVATDELKKTVWVVQEREYCVPKPRMCDRGCPCGPGGAVNSAGGPKPDQLPPQCSPVRTRKELVKKEITIRKPIWKCAVMCCGHCPGDCHYATMGQRSVPDAPSDPVNPDTPKATTTMRSPAAWGDESAPTIRMPHFE